jgi:WD40 repeat protein
MRPDAFDPDDEQFVAALVAYDDALAAGLSAEEARDGSTAGDVATQTVDELHDLLDLLESVWPRHATVSLDDVASAVDESGLNGLSGQVGRFRIVRELGRGGFGVVYLAEDTKLRRRVALKLPRPEMLLAGDLRQRFLREAQATAALDHPNILPAFETGEIGSLCYLVSPYCAGGTLAEHLAGRVKPLAPRQAAKLTLLLAEATHYAHTRGVLHRDLKPGNVLVEAVGEPNGGAAGELDFLPRISDFGLAQFVDADGDAESSGLAGGAPSLATRTGAIFGTPRYMAPEQAEGRRDAIGPATDVYGLGVILYEALTGAALFSAPGRLELLRQVLEQDPTPPRQIRKDTPRDLEAICLKCLEKRPDRRYPTAAELAADLRRFLQGEPTVARPLTFFQRAMRWARKHPAATAWIGAALLVAAAAFAGLAIHSARVGAYAAALEDALKREVKQTQETDRQRRLADAQELMARQQEYANEIGQAWRMWQNGEGQTLYELLNEHRPGPGQQDVRGFAWHYLWSLGCNATHVDGQLRGVHGVQFSPDGLHCVTWTEGGHVVANAQEGDPTAIRAYDETIIVWHVPTRSLRWRLKGDGPPYGASFTADGSQVIAVCGFGTIQVWDVASGERLRSTQGPTLRPSVFHRHSVVAFSPNAQEFAYTTVRPAENGELANAWHIWDLPTGQSRALPPLAAPHSKTARYSPDGTMLAVGVMSQSEDFNVIQIFDAMQGKLLKTSPALSLKPAWEFAFSPDQRTLVIGTWRGGVAVWDWETDALEYHSLASEEVNVHVDVSPRDGTIASGFQDRAGTATSDHLLLWQGAPSAVLAKPPTSGGSVFSVAFSPDGETLAYGADGGLLWFWSLRQHAEFQTLSRHAGEAWCAAFAPDGRLLASGSDDHTVKLWDPKAAEEKATLAGHTSLVAAVAFSPDGRTLATAGFDQTIKLWDVASRREQCTLTGHEAPIRSLAFYAGGKLLVSVGDDRTVKIWDADAGRLETTLQGHEDKIRTLAFDARSGRFFTGDNDGVVKLWDVKTQALVRSWKEADEVQSLAVTPDGNLLAAGSKEGLIRLYSMPDGRLLHTLETGEGAARSLAFSPDGRTLASGGEDRAVTLWHVATGQQLFSLPGVSAQVNGLAFAPNGQTLAAATHDGQMILWRAAEDEYAMPRPALP